MNKMHIIDFTKGVSIHGVCLAVALQGVGNFASVIPFVVVAVLGTAYGLFNRKYAFALGAFFGPVIVFVLYFYIGGILRYYTG